MKIFVFLLIFSLGLSNQFVEGNQNAYELVKSVPKSKLESSPATWLMIDCVTKLNSSRQWIGTSAKYVMYVHEPRVFATHGLGEFRFSDEPGFSKAEIASARVYSSNGEILDVSRFVNRRDKNTDHLIYETSRYLILSLPQVKRGDVIEVTVDWKQGDSLWEYPWSRFGSLLAKDLPVEMDLPILKYRSTIDGIKTIKQKAHLSGLKHGGFSQTDTSFEVVDVEPSSSSTEHFGVTFSSHNISELVDSYRKVYKDCTSSDQANCPALQEFAKELRSSSDSTEQKVLSVVEFIHQNVRYRSEGDALPVNMILDRGFGDCDELSLTFSKILELAEIEGGLALVNSETPDLDQNVPCGLDHAIGWYIDETSAIKFVEMTNPYGCDVGHLIGRTALVLKKDSFSVEKIEAAKPGVRGHVRESLTGFRSRFEFSGGQAASMRRKIVESTNRNKAIAEILALPVSDVVQASVIGADSLSNRLIVRATTKRIPITATNIDNVDYCTDFFFRNDVNGQETCFCELEGFSVLEIKSGRHLRVEFSAEDISNYECEGYKSLVNSIQEMLASIAGFERIDSTGVAKMVQPRM